ncbi:DNA polymerase III subunit alpha [Halosquirtibacter xylanolyticus]|uniref:DNA polymerase III subunit alpha n=1 Tax=Halosquirtibacter xylanolyticus TaxID=3374599 RepID=UPI0037482564|nr:DNA polymerase III subunit alpha [Prolixibacteraceae bacterium]
MTPFTHLHVHSQYSILDGAAGVKALVSKAKENGMKAVALTDHGTMFGIKEFHAACKANDIKPILGCETYVAKRNLSTKKEKVDRSGHHLILLAKNEQGYKNLLHLISVANTDGMYYRPRIDKDLLEKYREGIIVTSACLGGEIPQWIMKGEMEKADETIQWFKSVFGEDYYLELQRHPCQDPRLRTNIYENQVLVNQKILELGEKHGVKVIAANDVHFVNKEDAEAHDILICLNTGKDYDDPNRMRYTRQEWFKTSDEMYELFSDIPHVVSETDNIADKIEYYELNSAPIMPEFPIPLGFATFEQYKEKYNQKDLESEFKGSLDRMGGYEGALRVKLESDYLAHLVYEGVKDRFPDNFTEDKKERIDFELETIKSMGFPGYFLIVQDFICAARDMGVIVGPGRGSAAGSAVAYAIGITNVDPIKYDLLFERFLNPDRISMPDIDIDFDDDGRQMVLDWVTEKYGHDKVAHICTFGTMAAKMALKDVARVLKLPLSEANRLAKMVPEAPKMTLKKAYAENPDLEKEKRGTDQLVSKTISLAESLEGCVRQTGVHACGVLIGRDTLSQNIPVMPTKGEALLTTQYDGRFVEDIGLLKMDFLGLKTLSIIKESLDNIKLSKGIDIDIDGIPMDDQETYKLFSRGDTTAIFQFESPGMKKYLRMLQPNRFEDLVAMNALYRPGPMEYIPDFINRKHGVSDIIYDHPMMEPYLKNTYGITVFQEQVMLQSRALGNFTRGQSDTLRKAMGKKNMRLMEELKAKFIEGCKNNVDFMTGCEVDQKDPDRLIGKIWSDWEAFASYAFNKSHSVCYAYIAYQTGYLKAHYPAEFMAAVLSRNLSNIDKLSNFMEECRHMELDVKGPDVNESYRKFTVNKEGVIRYGLAGVKGVGEGAVDAIIEERDNNGIFNDIFDFVERIPLKTVNKKNIEGLAVSGGFDLFEEINRAQFFEPTRTSTTFVEDLIAYGNKIQSDQQGNGMGSLFGDLAPIEVKKPNVPIAEEWPKMELLEREKELIGIYLSSHPLDDYRFEIDHFASKQFKVSDLSNLDKLVGKEVAIAGMVTDAKEAMTKTGKPFSNMTFEDFSGNFRFFFFGKNHENYSKFCKIGSLLLVKGRVEQSMFRPGELEFNVTFVEFLSNLREKVKSLDVEIPSDLIDQDFNNAFQDIVDQNNGQTLLTLSFVNKSKKQKISLISRNKRVFLSDSFLSFLQKYEEITFKLN